MSILSNVFVTSSSVSGLELVFQNLNYLPYNLHSSFTSNYGSSTIEKLDFNLSEVLGCDPIS